MASSPELPHVRELPTFLAWRKALRTSGRSASGGAHHRGATDAACKWHAALAWIDPEMIGAPDRSCADEQSSIPQVSADLEQTQIGSMTIITMR
jgi:hypothetical protein